MLSPCSRAVAVTPAPKPVPALNGVRGWAFLSVVLMHSNDFLGWRLFYVDGIAGVWLFFSLSGFLLTRQLLDEGRALWSGRVLARYFWHRFLRIYPLFGVYVVCLGLLAHVPAEKCWRVLALSAKHGVDWSLVVECRFYLILPLLILPWAFQAVRRFFLLWLVGITAGVVWVFPFWASESEWLGAHARALGNDMTLEALPYLSAFLPGVIAAYCASRWPFRASAARAGYWTDCAGIVALATFLIVPLVETSSVPGLSGRVAGWWFPYGIAYAAWLYLLASGGGGRLARALEWRFMQLLGAVSYPGYLFHIFVLFYLRRWVQDGVWLYLGLACIGVLGASCLLHWSVERPLSRLRWRDAGGRP